MRSWMEDQARAGPSKLGGGAMAGEAERIRPMAAILGEDHAAFASLSEALFSRLAATSRSSAALAEENSAFVSSTLQSLAALDKRARGHLRIARQHARNQQRIERLEDALRTREERTKLGIQELGRIKAELDRMCKITSEELRYIDRAEQQPLSFDDILSYSARLASVTSAPPGFKLPTRVPPAAAAEPDEEQAGDAGGAGPKSKPPTAYYDPKMPSMPENLPFPDEGMIRRGALGALATGQGITFAPLPAGPEEAGGADNGAEAAPQQLSEAAREELRQREEAARLAREAEEADAFDLDLN